jgi:hypothetical protein
MSETNDEWQQSILAGIRRRRAANDFEPDGKSADVLAAEHVELKTFLTAWLEHRKKNDSNAATFFALLETAIELAIDDVGNRYAREIVAYTFDRIAKRRKGG